MVRDRVSSRRCLLHIFLPRGLACQREFPPALFRAQGSYSSSVQGRHFPASPNDSARTHKKMPLPPLMPLKWGYTYFPRRAVPFECQQPGRPFAPTTNHFLGAVGHRAGVDKIILSRSVWVNGPGFFKKKEGGKTERGKIPSSGFEPTRWGARSHFSVCSYVSWGPNDP